MFVDSVDAIIKNLEDQVPGCLTSGLTVEEYLLWAVDNPLTSLFQQLIFQVKIISHKNLSIYSIYFLTPGLPCCAGSETDFSARRARGRDGVASQRGEKRFHLWTPVVLDIIRLVELVARLCVKFFDQRRISA